MYVKIGDIVFTEENLEVNVDYPVYKVQVEGTHDLQVDDDIIINGIDLLPEEEYSILISYGDIKASRAISVTTDNKGNISTKCPSLLQDWHNVVLYKSGDGNNIAVFYITDEENLEIE